MYIGLHESTCYSCHVLMIPEFSRQILEEYTNIKFHENTRISSDSQVIPYGRTDGQTDRQTGRQTWRK